MKHPTKIILLILGLFLLTHIIGLWITHVYLEQELPYSFQRPTLNTDAPITTTVYIIGFILVGTILILLLAKYKLGMLWKIWFGLALALTLAISFSAFLPSMIALIIAIMLSLLRIFWQNPVLHNLTEIFMYGALAAIFSPILTMSIAILLLIAIAIYDFIAVRKTQHMVALAEFQMKEKLFAGLYIPYGKNIAILGGGDIAFPLIFAGMLLPYYGWNVFIISVTSLLALGVLFLISKKKVYYPAMPFITVGCLVGYGILLLVHSL